METQIIADITPKYVAGIADRVHSVRLMQNYTFMPKYHLNDIVNEHGDDVREVVKQIIESDWGVWSPRDTGVIFKQFAQFFDDGNVKIEVALLRDTHERKTVYVYRESNPRYGIKVTEAAVSCYMCDLDDDGQFYSSDIDNEMLLGTQGYSEGVWKIIDLRY